MKYTFLPSTSCNMCGSDDHRVIGKRLNQSQGYNPHKKIGITTTVLKCKNCGLKFASPIPIPESLNDHYDMSTQKYFDKTFQKFDPNTFKSELSYFKSIYKGTTSIKALDIGAGLGNIMKAMEAEGLEAYGLEPSKSFYNFAVNTMGISSERLWNQTTEEMDFEKESFDLIVLSAVFEHLYDPNKALKKALSWLKKGGLIYIGVPSAHSLNQELINLMYKIRGLDYVSNISPMHPPFHIYEFTEKSFQKNSLLNKYTIEKTERVTYQTYLPKILNSIIFPFIKITKTDMNIMVWLRKN
jgi:2-polyprenyl-3-methyl-5-hydroxy-6-metoxy-1,4-benzoquinol methylase